MFRLNRESDKYRGQKRKYIGLQKSDKHFKQTHQNITDNTADTGSGIFKHYDQVDQNKQQKMAGQDIGEQPDSERKHTHKRT